MSINYEIKNSLLFPYSYGYQHFKMASSPQIEWKERVMHITLGILEWIPVVNYIIAIADRILHPRWLWDFISSEINVDQLPFADQTNILLYNCKNLLPGLGIGIRDEKTFSQEAQALQLVDYKWYQILEKQDTVRETSLTRSRNFAIMDRINQPFMQGKIEGKPVVFISRPTARTATYEGKELSIIFNDGSCIPMCRDLLGNCFSYISRLPEVSPGLIDFAKTFKTKK